jgi:hypothetical protein
MKRQRRSKLLAVCVASASCLMMAGILLAAGKPGLVTTRDGRSYEGDVVERDKEIVISVRGIETVLPRDQVAGIDYAPYAERFSKKLEALAQNDADGRVKLAREAFERKEYALAQQAVNAALMIDPTHADARSLDALIATTQQLPTNQSPATPRDPAPTSRPAGSGERPQTLSAADIDIIRRSELRSTDKVQVQFLRGVVKRYVESKPGLRFTEFTRKPPVEQAMAIFADGTDEMIADVRIRNDPSAVANYARSVNTAVVQGCATSVCHGNAAAGGFRLLTSNEGADAAITNFYLLNRYKRTGESGGGVFASNQLSMVSRGSADKSLLLNYMLNPKDATIPHPAVHGYKGIVPSTESPIYRAAEKWMNEDLSQFVKDYSAKISYAAPSTQPAK